ncbi:MAG: hypothetical protein ABEJ31_14685 [Haloarculaceae archaeon]
MPSGHTRRDVLSSVTKASLLTGTTGAAGVGYRLSTLPLDLRNLSMPARVASRLARSASVDWAYCGDAATARLGALSPIGGDGVELQSLSPDAGFVSTPRDGIAAGVTETGRLSTLLAPHTGFTHQLPYYPYDRSAPLLGAKPREGSFAGLRLGGGVTWLWDDAVEHAMGYEGDSGVLRLTYRVPAGALAPGDGGAGPADGHVAVDERLAVLPGTGTVTREFRVANRTDAALDGQFVYHTQANVTANQQNFAVWESAENRLTAGRALRWTDREGPYELRVATDGPVADSGAADTGPDAVDGAGPDGALPAVLSSDADAVTGRYLSGYLARDLTVPAGEHRDLAVFLSCGPDVGPLPGRLRSSRQRRLRRARGYWRSVGDGLDLSGIPDRYRAAARRAAVTVLGLVDPDSGSVSASGNLQPSYWPSWPRDGAFAAVALARVGLADPARAFLGEFLPAVQRDDGSFRQCYDSRGGDAGLLAVENDQQPLYAWAVRAVHAATGDDAFLRDAWPAVRAALEYTVDAIAADDLLVATPDIHEAPTSGRQSLWANAMAYEGLLAGAGLAAAVGADPRRYRRAAETVGDAVLELTTPAGYLVEDTTDDGHFSLGSPLGWSSSGLLLALTELFR